MVRSAFLDPNDYKRPVGAIVERGNCQAVGIGRYADAPCPRLHEVVKLARGVVALLGRVDVVRAMEQAIKAKAAGALFVIVECVEEE